MVHTRGRSARRLVERGPCWKFLRALRGPCRANLNKNDANTKRQDTGQKREEERQ